MSRPCLTGQCDFCRKYKETEIVQDDWRIVLEWFEICSDCKEEQP